MAVTTVRNMLRTISGFFRWLDENELAWELPKGAAKAWQFNRLRLMTDSERAASAAGPATFSGDHLSTLFNYATERERRLIVIALNCGFAQSEWCSLRWDEVQQKGDDVTIKRIRRKTHVYGEFLLWPESIEALDWFRKENKRMGATASPYVLLSKAGEPASEQSIANAWASLRRRIISADSHFPKLSFKYLRKTAAQMVRDVSDGETAKVLLCHGSPVPEDELLEMYSVRSFAKCDEALKRVRAHILPVLREHWPQLTTLDT